MIAPLRIADYDTPEFRQLDPNLPRHAGLYMGTDSWDGFGWERDLVALPPLHRGGNRRRVPHRRSALLLRRPRSPPTSTTPRHRSSPTNTPVARSRRRADSSTTCWPATSVRTPRRRRSITRRSGSTDTGLVRCTPTEMNVTFRGLDPTTPVGYPSPLVEFVATPGAPQPSITLPLKRPSGGTVKDVPQGRPTGRRRSVVTTCRSAPERTSRGEDRRGRPSRRGSRTGSVRARCRGRAPGTRGTRHRRARRADRPPVTP